MSSLRPLALACVSACCAVAALAAPSAAQTSVSLNSRAAYLHVVSDPAPNATPIALAPLGALPGTCLRLAVLGDYDPGPGGDTATVTYAVFSASTTLLAGSALNRVVDAVDAGVDVLSATTFIGNKLTDIAEDFAVADASFVEVTVRVPEGAAYLFVTAGDHYFTDNSDPDGDYAVELTVVGCWTDLGHGLAGAGGTPQLVGTGTLIGGTPASLELTGALPSSSAALVIGFDLLNAPFKGGLLVPCVDVFVPGLPTGLAGSLSLPTVWPLGVPAGFEVHSQIWVVDPTGPSGFSASNAVTATTP